ncbi:hypothetical protein [Lacinutrix himadriensis]|uniref:hypothetical protein n=1 Tax=Lacinutrix himadriensis TaxID=641549 RepID=UPI000AC63F7E|nr:hypothetical protein [Lacinutrix himadriensis]
MSQEQGHENPQLISYNLLRQLIGLLGIILPILLIVGAFYYGNCEIVQSSISDYYHTKMRNILVGVLCAVAFFMFTYKGYDIRDSIAGNLACVFALGVAFFPTGVDTLSECAEQCIVYEPWIKAVHFTFAGLFFGVLIYFSLFLFTESKTPKAELEAHKRKRNVIFKTCGYVMIACVAFIALYFFYLQEKFPELQYLNPVFWLESIALWAFGISWITKGELIFSDKHKKEEQQ